jgi:hypothetical protein
MRNAPGFTIDWSSGAVPEVPNRLTCYKVSFYVKLPNERLLYVIYYAQDYYSHDPSSGRGYVYLPGRDDQSYSLNVGTIIRGMEGQWFRSSSAEDDIAVPLIKNARVGRNPSEPGLDPGEPGLISGTVVDSTGQPCAMQEYGWRSSGQCERGNGFTISKQIRTVASDLCI